MNSDQIGDQNSYQKINSSEVSTGNTQVESNPQQLSPKVKKQIQFACLFALLVGNMMLLCVASFLPTFIQNNSWSSDSDELTTTDVSMILAIFSIAQIAFAPFNSIFKNYFGAKETIVLGFVMMTLSTFALGWIAMIENSRTFQWIAMVTRFLQGLGDIMLQITCYNVMTTVFYDDVLRQISYIELIVGLGLGLGPTIGSLLFTALGYEWTMYTFGFINTAALVVVYILLPKQMNNISAPEEEESEEGALADPSAKNAKANIKVTWCLLFNNRHFSFALLICFIGTVNIVYFYGYIGPYLLELGRSESDIGFIIASQQLTYLPMCLLFPQLLTRGYFTFPRKLQFLIAMIGFGFCSLMLGPSEIFGSESSSLPIILAFPILGLFQYFVFIPIIPEMLERVQVQLQIEEGKDLALYAAVNDKVNDAYGVFYASSQFFGPIIGGFLVDNFDYRSTGNFVALFNFVFAIILFIFNCGPQVFKEDQIFNEKLDSLTKEGRERAKKLQEEDQGLELQQNQDFDPKKVIDIGKLEPLNKQQ